MTSIHTENKLPRLSPEASGIDPTGIQAFIEAVNASVGGLHGLMLLRHGQVVAEGWWKPYSPDEPHLLYSLSKSFMSTAVGLAIEEDFFTLDSPVISFFPEDLPEEVGANLAAMRVRHLLSMSTGHDKDATGAMRDASDGNWTRAALAVPVEHAPGTKFVYNSAASYLLSAIVQKTTGKTLVEFLTPRLFLPLGIEYDAWESCPRGINVGGWGLRLKTEDIAKFGQLYLQKGVWEGKPLIPEAWVAEATSAQVSNGDPAKSSDWSQGYGYQFWRCQHGCYRGDGAFGQYCVVFPENDAVLAIHSGVGNMQAVLDAAWEHLLPAMKSEPLPENPSVNLKETLATLAIPSLVGQPTSPLSREVSGRTFALETTDAGVETVSLAFEELGATLTLRDTRGEFIVHAGIGEWSKTVSPIMANFVAPGAQDGKLTARGLWTAEDVFTFQFCFYQTPYLLNFNVQFEGNTVKINPRLNVGFGGTELPQLVGHQA